MCQTLCQVASYTLSDLVFVTTFMTKKALVSFILKGRKLKVSLVARMPGSSPMYCCWPPWKFIYHLWAVEGIGEEAVAQSPQEHLGLWRRIALLGCLSPFAFFWNGSLCSGRGGTERGALSWRPGSWVSSSQVHQNGIWARLTHPPPGVCPDWLTIPDNLGTSWAVSMKSNGALILDKCSMMDGLWLTHFPHWGSEVTWEGRLEVPAPGRWGDQMVSFCPALFRGRGGCLCRIPWHNHSSKSMWSTPGVLSSYPGKRAHSWGCDRNWVWVPPPELQIFLFT